MEIIAAALIVLLVLGLMLAIASLNSDLTALRERVATLEAKQALQEAAEQRQCPHIHELARWDESSCSSICDEEIEDEDETESFPGDEWKHGRSEY